LRRREGRSRLELLLEEIGDRGDVFLLGISFYQSSDGAFLVDAHCSGKNFQPHEGEH
jgi:hypothetical protein